MSSPERSARATTPAAERARLDDLLSAYDRLRIASGAVTRHGAATAGLALSDLRALVVVRREPGITPSALAKVLELTRGGMTAVVDRLVAAGVLRRTVDPVDRRSLPLEVTPAGIDALELVRGDFVEAFSEMFDAEGLDVAEVEAMTARFDRLATSFERVGAARARA